MSTERTGCETLDKAIVLAPKVGINPEMVTCPFLSVCTGETCIVMDNKDDVRDVRVQISDAQDKFFDRLQKREKLVSNITS